MSYCQRCADLEKELTQSKSAAAELEWRVEELEKLAYIGDHHFHDLTWKHRCTEELVRARDLEARLAQAEAAAAAIREALALEAQTHTVCYRPKDPDDDNVYCACGLTINETGKCDRMERILTALSADAGRDKE